MKLFFLTVFAVLIGTVSFAADVVNFDGCDAKLVPGTNYYNLVDPRCKTESEKFQSTGAEERKKLAAEAAKED